MSSPTNHFKLPPEAPYLTHKPGIQFPLSPPDNHGQQRQPATSSSSKKNIKKNKLQKRLEVKQEEDRIIRDAVVNAGRTPSPLQLQRPSPAPRDRNQSWETLRPDSRIELENLPPSYDPPPGPPPKSPPASTTSATSTTGSDELLPSTSTSTSNLDPNVLPVKKKRKKKVIPAASASTSSNLHHQPHPHAPTRAAIHPSSRRQGNRGHSIFFDPADDGSTFAPVAPALGIAFSASHAPSSPPLALASVLSPAPELHDSSQITTHDPPPGYAPPPPAPPPVPPPLPTPILPTHPAPHPTHYLSPTPDDEEYVYLIAWERDREEGWGWEERVRRDAERRTGRVSVARESLEGGGGEMDKVREEEQEEDKREEDKVEESSLPTPKPTANLTRELSLTARAKFARAAEERRTSKQQMLGSGSRGNTIKEEVSGGEGGGEEEEEEEGGEIWSDVRSHHSPSPPVAEDISTSGSGSSDEEGEGPARKVDLNEARRRFAEAAERRLGLRGAVSVPVSGATEEGENTRTQNLGLEERRNEEVRYTSPFPVSGKIFGSRIGVEKERGGVQEGSPVVDGASVRSPSSPNLPSGETSTPQRPNLQLSSSPGAIVQPTPGPPPAAASTQGSFSPPKRPPPPPPPLRRPLSVGESTVSSKSDQKEEEEREKVWKGKEREREGEEGSPPGRKRRPPPPPPPTRSRFKEKEKEKEVGEDEKLVQGVAYGENLKDQHPNQPLLAQSSSIPTSNGNTSDLNGSPPAPRIGGGGRRPLPVPPVVLSDRIDAYTQVLGASSMALTASGAGRGMGSAGMSNSSSVEVFDQGQPGTQTFGGVEDEEGRGGGIGERDRRASDEFVYTDLDLLLARLELADQRGRGEENYDDLLLITDLLGTALPTSSSTEEIDTLIFAPVELIRRRVDKNGKVKQKLSVVGVRCVDCMICLSRLRVGEMASSLPRCLHVYHAKCIQSWLRRSRVCPICREEVFKKEKEKPQSTAPPEEGLL
ncbi:hypothetical protein T439DRAFT_328205 [Meredithblackwellia eburnea MCA 4105]